MHWVLGKQSAPSSFRHFPYLNMLPSPATLQTPLHFSDSELQSFRGPNLYGATLDRKRQWDDEWQRCRNIVKTVNLDWAVGFTWARYLTSSTYLSSRAITTPVLSRSPTLFPNPSSYPVLLPGVDALNHNLKSSR
ncbi:hypothetical protein NEOLEDRAFT_379281 [Neolentinus lepideus HHB14362 ss-1]|uniref:SET domain-containing protein n=1 Tax=Neolentinus lepideus HHB14362 ss-1 TaxID=1314782 RepID=A0A165SBX1_9AGAM|nr:hypothetical protein NEOLEDRAFT_379281 [Neolentinus lepideus HHB14362 ss-1]